MIKIDCYKCGMIFGMPDEFYKTALQMREKMSFYCPAGHSQHFVTGESKAQKLRRERDRMKQQLAQRDDEIKHERDRRKCAERSAAANRGVVTRIKRRSAAGTCPCCNRTFKQLAAHMKNKHPEYAKKEKQDA